MADFTLGDRLARNILDMSGVALALVHGDSRIAYANKAFRTLLGHGEEPAAGLLFDSMLETPPAPIGSLERPAECLVSRSDGSRIWVHVVVSRIAGGAAGEPDLVVQLVDIGQQKQTETQLLLDQSRMEFALEAAGQGVWDHDVVTDTMYYSPGWRRMRGIPQGEAVDGSQESWLARVHPDDREHLRRMAKRQGQGDDDFRVLEYRELHRDGHYIWIQSRGRPVAWDENGKALRTLGTDTDITDRKHASEQYDRLSGRLALALDASRLGVFEADIGSGRVVWDERMYEIYGLPFREGSVPEAIWLEGLHPADRARAQEVFERAVAARIPYAAQFRVIRPDGTTRHVRSRANPFIDANGGLKYIGAEWDITADVEQAEELHLAKARLQHAALHDYLTGLPNRRYLDETLAEQRRYCEIHGGALALLHIDLDWFKQINDNLGHAAGDFMLRHVADVLRANVREEDFIARVGGDEFVVLCRFEGDETDLGAMAQRIVQHIRLPVPYGDEVMQIGASVGIACERADAADPQRLQRDADAALYRAKNAGRNGYQFARH